jgi:hypothetical protein
MNSSHSSWPGETFVIVIDGRGTRALVCEEQSAHKQKGRGEQLTLSTSSTKSNT